MIEEARKSPVKTYTVSSITENTLISVECIKDKMSCQDGTVFYYAYAHVYLYLNKVKNNCNRKTIAETTIVDENFDVVETKLQEWLDERQSALVDLLLIGYTRVSVCEGV